MEESAVNLRDSRRDPEAFGRFYRDHAPGLLRSFTRRVLEVETALDLTAETMAQAYLGRHRFRGKTNAEARGWLYGIADRQLVSYIRRKGIETRALRRLGLERPQLKSEAEALMIERDALGEMQDAITLALQRLTPDQRAVVELRFVEQLPYREIAWRLGVSEDAARARLARAVKGLRGVLNQQPLLEEGL